MPQKNERRGANESMSMPALTPIYGGKEWSIFFRVYYFLYSHKGSRLYIDIIRSTLPDIIYAGKKCFHGKKNNNNKMSMVQRMCMYTTKGKS